MSPESKLKATRPPPCKCDIRAGLQRVLSADEAAQVYKAWVSAEDAIAREEGDEAAAEQHMRWEEEHIFKSLSTADRAELTADHALVRRLIRSRDPSWLEVFRAHGTKESAIYRK